MATKDAPAKMTAVVKDVIRETDGKIDVLAVTHQHWDHVSGFTQAEDAFKGLTVGEVWVAWTEDDTDPLAKSLQKDHANALAVLQACATRMAAAGQDNRAAEIHNVLGLSGAAGDKTSVAFNKAKSMGREQPKIRYLATGRQAACAAPADRSDTSRGSGGDNICTGSALRRQAHPQDTAIKKGSGNIRIET